MSFAAITMGSAVGLIGAVGAASFALVDTLKVLPNGGIANIGFVCIERALQAFFPEQTRATANGGIKRLFDELHGNWVSGLALSDQKAIAKSLIELRLTGATAAQFSLATDVNAIILKNIGDKMAGGARLETAEANVYTRFDQLLGAIVNDGFQHADQRYQSWTKFAAMLFAIVLSVFGGASISSLDLGHYFGSSDMWLSVLGGFLATPLAPIAKDLSSALASVKIAQALKR